MNVTLYYQEDPNVKVSSVEAIGNINNFCKEKGQMDKHGDKWIQSFNLPPGEYHYSFLINGNLRLNDPLANIYAPDSEEKIWSVVIINDQGQRLYNNVDYQTHIEEYKLSTTISEISIEHKKLFSRYLDSKVVARFTFSNVTGLHTVTTAWYDPNGQLFQSTDNYLLESDSNSKPIMQWFWLDIKDAKYPVESGVWTLKLFIDGAFVLEDKFNLLDKSSYTL